MYQPAPIPFPAESSAPPTGGDAGRTVPAGAPLALILGWLATDQLLGWRFVDVMPAWVYNLGLAALALVVRAALRGVAGRLPMRRWLVCLAIATVLLLLGGEGRFFYANLDWQVRDAVLRDMAIHPWPFAYATGDGPMLLRAPIGMYLVPALAAKLAGQAGGDIGLLVQNGLLLGSLLALASTLFATPRARRIALGTFLAFSGLDIVGQALMGHLGAFTPTAHLEGWNRTQYSSVVTLAFWVPQHALAGWIPATAFLLWRTGRLRIGLLVATLPLVALWSPFGALGAAPFALGAGISDLVRRRIRVTDLGQPGIAALLCLPGLLYLISAGDAVGSQPFALPLDQWLRLEALEVAPFLLVAAPLWRSRFGGWPLGVAAACLLLMPFWQIGWSIDFTMRASIPAFAILIALLADLLGGDVAAPHRKALLVGLLAVGSVTGLTEIGRALTFPTSPVPHCGFARAWDETFAGFPKGSYLAPLDRLGPLVRPAAAPVFADRDPVRCYDRQWVRPQMFIAGETNRVSGQR